MQKGFTRRPQADEPVRGKNYITPGGLERLKDEYRFLLTRERPAVGGQKQPDFPHWVLRILPWCQDRAVVGA